ncbi:ubiquitin-like domain-containing protein [Pseudogracilibacillus sp. SO30301A]|uniref:ubiquitin-like domain-containing protein n=1 Tax=Pseudogracilibacillus sp. SO30301A TaxID=3098291 RepID=UPI00300DD0D3
MQNILKPLLAVKSKSGYSIFTAILVTLFSTWVIFDATKAEVVIAADGEVQVVKTHKTTVGELLEEVGIQVGEYDELSHAENAEVFDGMKINFDTAKEVLLTVDGETDVHNTTAETVGEFLQEVDLDISEHDKLSPSDMTEIKEGLEIKVDKAFKVLVNDGGKEKEFWTTGGTVEELLDKNNIKIKKTDKVKPGLAEEVTEDMEVSIIHVEKESLEIEESIPFETEEQEDSSLEKGTTKTISEGTEGKVLKIYEVTKENKEEVERELIEEKVLEESKNKVVAVGTKEVQKEETTKTAVKNSSNESSSNESSSNESSSKESSEPKNDGKVFTVEATAYSADCSGCSGVTATGINIKQSPTPKVISVDPNVIPLGSKVWVEGYGEAIAGDTGGAIKGNRIDVLVSSDSEAKNWGRKTVQVKILN